MHLNQKFPSSQPPLRSRKKSMFGCQETERLDELAKVNSEGETSLQMGRKHFYGTTLNTVTPCAACKLLRRRCAEECPFSPYFSPLEPQKFAAVHKVFGASNVSKLLMEVPEGQRADAANSMVYEANLRLRDPIYGCMGAISSLQQQVQSLQTELHAIRAEILKHKYREATNFISSNHATLVSSMPNSTENSSQPLSLPSSLAPPSSSSSSSLLLPKLLPSHESIILSSLSSSSASNSVYTSNKSTMSHGSISSENIPYFV